jgi:hypothetical protein
MGVTFDATSFLKGTKRAITAIERAGLQGINDVASEVLRLGTFEVPHDKGILQGSGHVEPSTESQVIVGYNTVYAARLHEHPEYRFQKGRKGKYLEDPIKNNLSLFKNYIADAIKAAFV